MSLTYEQIVEALRGLPPMTEAERQEQRADWAYGQMACMSRYANATPEELAELRAMCRKEAASSAVRGTR